MGSKTVSKADIEIGVKRYSIACAPGQEARLQTLALSLNRRIETIREAVGDIGEARLFLVAALALIDEIDTLKASGETTPEAIALASSALLDAAARIDAIAERIETTHE